MTFKYIFLLREEAYIDNNRSLEYYLNEKAYKLYMGNIKLTSFNLM